MSLCSLDSSSSPCSGCTRGMLSPPGRGEVVEAKHRSIPVPWLGLGCPGGLQGCCQLPEVPVLRHRSSPADGWGTELLSQQDHWVTGLGTGEVPGGIWGRDGPRGTETPLKYSELGCSPHYLWPGHHGLAWPQPREGVVIFCPCGVTAGQAHPGGLCRGLCRDLPVHPKHPPPRSPHPAARGTQFSGGSGGSSKKPPAAVGSQHIPRLNGVLRVSG